MFIYLYLFRSAELRLYSDGHFNDWNIPHTDSNMLILTTGVSCICQEWSPLIQSDLTWITNEYQWLRKHEAIIGNKYVLSRHKVFAFCSCSLTRQNNAYIFCYGMSWFYPKHRRLIACGIVVQRSWLVMLHILELHIDKTITVVS